MEKGEQKLIHRWWFWVILAIFILIVFKIAFGNIKYQCQDGSVTNSPTKCQKEDEKISYDCSNCPKQNEILTKYQCYDGSVKDNINSCISPEQFRAQNIRLLNGTGNQVTDKFYLNEGAVIFKNTYKGQMNFIANLVNESADNVGLVANTIGTSETSSIVKVTYSGYYRIDVTAWSGSYWEIRIEQ